MRRHCNDFHLLFIFSVHPGRLWYIPGRRAPTRATQINGSAGFSGKPIPGETADWTSGRDSLFVESSQPSRAGLGVWRIRAGDSTSRSKPPSAVRSSKPHQLRCLADNFKQEIWWSLAESTSFLALLALYFTWSTEPRLRKAKMCYQFV